MRILAIDPGPAESAFVCWDTEKHDFYGERMGLNVWAVPSPWHRAALVAIEFPQSYGMNVGLSVFATCYEAGRIAEAVGLVAPVRLYGRPSIKGQIGGRKDSEINASLRMRHGDAKKGCKLEGVKKDIWAALALAVALDENPFLRVVSW
jgi:hypothetical protein